MVNKIPSVKESAPAYAAADNVVPALSAEEKKAQTVMARWDRKIFTPGGDDVAMTAAEAKEYDDALWVEIQRRARLSDLGITKPIPGEVFLKKIKARIKRNQRLLAESGGSG